MISPASRMRKIMTAAMSIVHDRVKMVCPMANMRNIVDSMRSPELIVSSVLIIMDSVPKKALMVYS